MSGGAGRESPPGGGPAAGAPRAPLTAKRLLGLDRSGPPPPETLRSQPLRPWTLPNAIGYVRIALIPVFLAVALSSGDGQDGLAFALFAIVAGGDYLDGIAARVTGQYSRLGALLDPLTDRLLVLSAALVAWHFELLPRWALAVLAARELFMLALTQLALRRRLDLRINMLGRWAVWPTMSALALALVADGWAIDALLLVGLAMTLAATALYVQDGMRELRRTAPSS